MNGDFSMLELFAEEVRSHAAVLTSGLLELESDPANPQRIEPLMRAAHSIKGAARIVGIDSAVRLAHVMEDALVACQEGRVRMQPTAIDWLLRGTDMLAELQQINETTVQDWSASHADDIASLEQRLNQFLRGETPAKQTTPAVSPAPSLEQHRALETIPNAPVTSQRVIPSIPAEGVRSSEETDMHSLFQDELRGNLICLRDGVLDGERGQLSTETAELLVEASRSIKGGARILGLTLVGEIGANLESFLIEVRDGKRSLNAGLTDQILEVVGWLAELLQLEPEGMTFWCQSSKDRIHNWLNTFQALQSRSVTPADVNVVPEVATPNSPAAPIREKEKADVPTMKTVPVEPPVVTTSLESNTPAASVTPSPEAVVRVTAQSLNRLMGLAGESLVQARWLQPFSTALLKLKKYQDHLAAILATLEQSLLGGHNNDQTVQLVSEARQQATQCRQVLSDRITEFEDHAARAEDLNSRLYREVIVSRMRPFADGAHGFPRLVRDMARTLNKQARLEIIGQSTEVDRDVLDKLEAPLTHLLRNALDHGIEFPDERKDRGKPEFGTIRIEVRHRAGMLAITVADDGRGIDLEKLRRIVVDRGLTTAEMARNLNEPELLEFLFLPGFSTTSKVSEYSGRGVGLDVVHDTVRKIGGAVRITTALGRGTQFHLQLPITLSVLRAVLVSIAGEPYAFPHNRIDRLIRVPLTQLHSLENRQFVTIDGQNVGLLLAAQILELEPSEALHDDLSIVLMSDATGSYGLIVDAFRGEQDLVIRPLDPRLGKIPNVSAAAILDDGMPVLILDVEDLIRATDHFIQTGSLQRYARQIEQEHRQKRVLVVDDSITVREVERQLLRAAGYDVTIAVDGKEGWNTVRSEPFDLVVTDVDMPRMNGLELVAAIRSDAQIRDLPIIIVSYKERPEDRFRGLEVGANRYLTKSSFHDNTFLQAIRDLIGVA